MDMYLLVALLLIIAAVIHPAVLQPAQPGTCDASLPNYGCSVFGRCKTSERNCYCNPGFLGDGAKDNCTSSCMSDRYGSCDNATTEACIDLPDEHHLYRCACKKGFYYNIETKTCDDIDECNRQSCSPFSQCINEIGSYRCECCFNTTDDFAGITGFGYKGDGKEHCYSDSIIHFADSDQDSRFRNTSGYFHINVPGGFPYFGGYRWDIYVHTDGVISFDSPSIPYFGSEYGPPTHRSTKFIAPFWTRLKASPKFPDAGLYVDSYSQFRKKPMSQTISRALRGLIDELGPDWRGYYKPRQYLIATWKNMEADAAFIGSKNQRARITFQTVLTSNGTHSFGFTSYAEHPDDTDWTVPLEGVYIGQSHQIVPVKRPAKTISDLFQNPEIPESCSKMTFLGQRGRWHQVFGPPYFENTNIACIDEGTRQFKLYGRFETGEEEEGSLASPSLYCPCLEQQAYSDNRFVPANVPEVKVRSCHISRFFKNITSESKQHVARAYCCYDEQGILVTKGFSSGGVVPDGLEDDMRKLKKACCSDAPLCESFHRIYTPVTCKRYYKPRIAYIRGASHFNSFANEAYTFNGRGEFTYFSTKSPIIDVQLRLVEVKYTTGYNTSFVKAIALQCDVPADPADSDPAIRIKHLAEVRVSKSGKTLELLLDKKSTPLPYRPSEFKSMFYVACEKDFCEISCKFSNNIFAFQTLLVNDYLELNTTIPSDPEVPLLRIQGLAGSAEGKLSYQDALGNEVVVEHLDDEAQIQKFGEHKQTKADASLFTYDDGESWHTYNNFTDEYSPSLWSEVKKTINADNVDLIMHCGADSNCQYDQIVTGDKEISTATHKALEIIQTDRNALGAVTPQWKTTPRIILSIHRNHALNLGDHIMTEEMGNNVTVDYYEFNTSLPALAYKLDKATGALTFFTNYTNIWRHASYYGIVYAVKNGPGSVIARSRWELEFFVCACEKDTQCDYTYADKSLIQIRADENGYYRMPCNCPPQANEQYCQGGQVMCITKPCHPNATCTENPKDPAGYRCRCKSYFSGNGFICKVEDCPLNHGCNPPEISYCARDLQAPAVPVCSCFPGYQLNADGKTCEDINECLLPSTCNFQNNEICRNTNGSYYCECEAGYKPEKGGLRLGCLKAPYTYGGTIEFQKYWNLLEKKWLGWDNTLLDPSSARYIQQAREMEPVINLLLEIVEPTSEDLYTYISRFSKGNNEGVVAHFKFYPSKSGDAKLIQDALRDYFTKMPDGSTFKVVEAKKITVALLDAKSQCEQYKPCGSPFASCYTSIDDGRICQCNPGFLPLSLENIPVPDVNVTSCASYCHVRNCNKTTTHSCRDIMKTGPQCLCRKGYEHDPETNECKFISYCSVFDANGKWRNPCGEHADCNDVLGGYECKCKPGYVPSGRPAPAPLCIAPVLYCQNEEGEPAWPDGVEVKEEANFTAVAIPVGFPFAGTEQWKLFINHDGFISFGKRPTATELASFFPSQFGYFAAPFWSDFEDQTAEMSLRIYDKTLSYRTLSWQAVIEQIRDDIQNASDSYPYYNVFGYPAIPDVPHFEPQTIVIVTWKNMRLKPFTSKDFATFQIVIASNGLATVAISNYDALTSTLAENWANYPHRGFVGFQGGARRLCLDQAGFGEGPKKDCRKFDFKQLTDEIADSKLPSGRHVFLVANEKGITTSHDRQCFNTLKRWLDQEDIIEDLKNFHDALDDEKPQQGVCPWTETQVKLDQRFMHLIGPAKKVCYMKSYLSKFEYEGEDGTTKTNNIAPYCCYRNGALLTQTTSFTHVYSDEFFELQNSIYRDCCQASAHCPIAAYFAPVAYAISGYEPPVTVAIFGDPHIITFDGINITFKGRGDYVLFKHPKLNVQGRFDKLANVNNGSALMALTWKTDKYDQVLVTIDSKSGNLTVTVGGKEIDLNEYTTGTPFDTNGNIKTKLGGGGIAGFTMTYVDGLSFDVTAMTGFTAGAYLQARLRLPRDIYLTKKEDPTGLLGDFIQPDGKPYQPKFYGNLFVGDEQYFHKYGKNWAVSNAKVTQLFKDSFDDPGFIPMFYESYLIAQPEVHPLFDRCGGSMPCTYDLAVTDDELLANATLKESISVHKIRREAAEKPPKFKKQVLVWMIYLSEYYNLFTPEVEDMSDDVTFKMETDFPRHLYTLEPTTGRFILMTINEEVKDTLLHKGPFYFNLIAVRGATGASSYMPVAVRICNCLDERSCDFSDDIEAIKVGIIPTANTQRYSIARCNCFPFQTGMFCDNTYDACQTSPCFPGVACIRQSQSDMKKPAFQCFGCPYGMEGDGVHCWPKDYCKNVVCPPPKICQSSGGSAKCECPEGMKPTPDGHNCQFVSRCNDPDKPKVCAAPNMKCMDASNGRFYCGCQPGFAPQYRVAYPPEITACIPIAYTYQGQVSFEKYYHPSHDIVGYSADYIDIPTDTYKTFARNITVDIQNAINILKYNVILGISIESVSPFEFNGGFTIDYFAYSLTKLKDDEIQEGLAMYFDQTGSVGTLVRIDEPYRMSFFIDICKSENLNPCQSIIDISICTQAGIKGVGPTCECKRNLGYLPHPVVTPDGGLECLDMCDSACKGSDDKSKCIRPDGRDKPHKCVCIEGYSFNNETRRCEEKPPICTPTSCGPNADCVPIDEDTSFICVCRPGYIEVSKGVCISYCEQASYCQNVSHAFSCTNLDKGYKCNCDPDYQWEAYTEKCIEIDKCKLGTYICPKHSTCHKDGVGEYSCPCDEDYLPEGNACYGYTLYPYGFTSNKVFIKDSARVWDTKFLSGFYYLDNLFYKINVGFDGFMSFDYLPPYKYFGKKLSTHLVAPFWMGLDSKPDIPSSGLHIDVFDKLFTNLAAEPLWKEVFNSAIRNLKLEYPEAVVVPDDAVPDMVVIATWRNITLAPASSYGQYKTTFQAVFTMTSGFSFVVFNYLEAPSETKWPTLSQFQPLVGYTNGTRITPVTFNATNGNPPSYEAVFVDGVQTRGRHVYAFNKKVDLQTRKCMDLYRNFPIKIHDTVVEINNSSDTVRLACPGFLKQVEVDPRWQLEIELPESQAVCYGGNFWSSISVPSGKFNVRSFCCYDTETDAWLDNTPPARHVGSFFQIKEYRKEQEELFETCCHHSFYCEAFSLQHPITVLSPDNYDAPAVGYVIGDPHVGILARAKDVAGSELTFNAQGEYILVKSKEFASQKIDAVNVQGRFSTSNTGWVTTRATFLTGIAVKVGHSEVVEVITHDGNLVVFRNGTKVNVTESKEVVPDGSFTLWGDGEFVGYVTNLGVSLNIHHVDNHYLEVRVTLPSYLENTVEHGICGLLTSFNKSPFIDCDEKTETIGADIWKNDKEAYPYGLRFKLAKKEQSLFSYLEGPSYEAINDAPADWKPVFREEIVGHFPPDVDEACAKSPGCEYDYTVTFSKTLGEQTAKSSKKYKTDQTHILAKRPDVFKGLDGRLIIRNDSATLFVVKPFGTRPGGMFYHVETNIPYALYKFDQDTGAFSMKLDDSFLREVRKRREAPYLRFQAISDPTADIWTPATFTCACDKISQCDLTYPDLDYTERMSNIKHNYFLPCNCPPTRRGTYCEVVFNPCDEKPCPENVKCTLNETSQTGFTCGACPPGYISVGGICKPKVCPENICTKGDCEVSKVDGNFKCNCWPGYELSPTNDKVCEDIDECKLGTHDCYRLGQGMQCTNVPGSFVCSCKSGYYPDNSTHIQTCIREKNQIDGVMKTESVVVDGVKVTWTAELTVVGSPKFVAVATQMEADLLSWYQKDLGQNAKSIVVKQLKQGSIQADYGAYFDTPVNASAVEERQKEFFQTSSSIGGMQGVDPTAAKITTDLCEQDTTCDSKSTKCVWDAVLGSVRCECLSGFVTNPKSSTSCVDNCAALCEAKHGAHVKCSRPTPSSYKCDCVSPYSMEGDKCVDKCASNPCQNGGTCGVSGTTVVCNCPPDFYGDTCDKKCGCRHDGICVPTLTSPTGYVCKCTDNYYGDKCQHECTCSNGGTCTVSGTTVFCNCPPGFYGEDCENACPCQHGGTCAPTSTGGFICKCPFNYYGDTCGIVCDCKNGGTCAPTAAGGFVCKCPENFFGEKCEGKCDYCKNGGTCDSKGTCWCKAGFDGEKCDHKIEERVVKEADNTVIIIISCVLGGTILILLCVTIYAVCFGKKKSHDSRENDVEIEVAMRPVPSAAPVFATPPIQRVAEEPVPQSGPVYSETSPPSGDRYYAAAVPPVPPFQLESSLRTSLPKPNYVPKEAEDEEEF